MPRQRYWFQARISRIPLVKPEAKLKGKITYKLVNDPAFLFLPASTDIIAMIAKNDTRK